jgi:hypothetical protein
MACEGLVRQSEKAREWFVTALALASAACFQPPPAVLGPMPGCYDVTASGWSSDHVAATGIKEVPAVMRIDDNPERPLFVPPAWRLQKPEYSNSAGWSELVRDWTMRGDTVRDLYAGKEHRMAGDSLRINLTGFRGGVTAFLTPTATGFEGPLQMRTSTAMPVPAARLALTRRNCAGLRLVSSRAPNETPVEFKDVRDYIIPPR